MSDNRGFTLVEIIVVLIIVSILAAVSIPYFTTSVIAGATRAAQNNLISIYNAEKSYYLKNGSWYSSGANPDVNLNANLNLNITDNNFTYTCAATVGPSYSCTATNVSDNALVLTVTGGTADVPNAIVYTGGGGCASSTGANPGCNPSCATDNVAYCPN